MAHSPTAHAGATLAALSEKLAAARSEEAIFANRLADLEAELALNAARLEEMRSLGQRPLSPANTHRSSLLNQRIADLLELRASLIAERSKRRRMIDEMSQRKEAIDAALSVLREKTAPQLSAAR